MYVLNDPIRFTDPTGHRCVEDGFEGSCNSVENKLSKKYNAELEAKRQKHKDEKRNWFQKFLRDKDTPMIMATVQEVTALIGEGALLVAVFQPEFAPVAAVVFAASWVIGRAASALGTAATQIQYEENLNGTNKTDVAVSWGSTLIGLYPPAASASSTANFLYTAERTEGWLGLGW